MRRLVIFVLCFLLSINPAVMQRFYADGGSIRYCDHVEYYGQPAFGIIYYKDYSIRIAKDAPATTLAHEMGHYLYHKQVWSGELRKRAGEAFAQTPLRECTDENFAIGYSMYCERGLGGKLAEFYREIESGI